MKSANEVYIELLFEAERVIRGPSSLAVSDDFWGEPSLVLRREPIPKTKATIESRTIYANMSDEEQGQVILRQCIWKAGVVRQAVVERLGHNSTETLQEEPEIQYVWVNLGWLQQAFQSLQRLAIPLILPETTGQLDVMYTAHVLRSSDRTQTSVSWYRGMSGPLASLTETWEQLWQQMGTLLHKCDTVLPKEEWTLPT